MSYDLHPGPIIDDVLFLKDSHRARDIFYNRELTKLVFRRADQKFFLLLNNNPITNNVKRYINIAGFGGVIDCGYRNLDHGLLEALIERWRPETHTFHLTIGEATVTLEDVNVLWGLPIEGGVVSGCEQPSSVAERIVRCHTLLGLTTDENDFKGNSLKLTTIYNHLNNFFPENALDLECMQRARCIILYLCGGTLFSDSSNNVVSLTILNNLEDLTVCGQLSWGSAVLAMLYRNLCKATSSSAKNIGGPLYILQLWAWSRITTIAPRILHPFDNRRPYGAMWREKLTYKDVISNSLRACRSQLHCLQEGEFKWRPYEEVISFIPEICISGSHSWQSECYLIYWDVVEFYTPQRVMRQFGMVQNIPRPVPTSINEHMTLHTLTRSGKPEKNWMNIHSEYVSVWNQRWQNVIQGVRCATPTVEPNYMQWFWSRTVLYITNPKSQEVIQPGFQDHGSRSQFLMDVISQTYRQAGDFMQTESTSNFQNFESLQNTANQVMGMLNEESRLHYPSHLQTGPANLGGDETVPHSLRMRERRCGNVRSGADTSNVQHENCQDGTSNVRSGADTSSGISSLPSLDLNL